MKGIPRKVDEYTYKGTNFHLQIDFRLVKDQVTKYSYIGVSADRKRLDNTTAVNVHEV